jgi:hypothetical protein
MELQGQPGAHAVVRSVYYDVLHGVEVRLGPGTDGHAGLERGQLQRIAAVERQVLNGLALDHAGDSMILVIDLRRERFHRHHLASFAKGQRSVDGAVGAGQYLRAADFGLKSLHLDPNVVLARRKRGCIVQALRIRRKGTGYAGRLVGDCDRRPGNRCT